MARDLAGWLALLEQRHPRAIELGLERSAAVRRRLGWPRLPFVVLTVAGTNGKGSAVAFLEAMLLAAGYRTGAYTSPHIRRYNERVRVDGVTVTDGVLCAAFEQVEAARGDTPLTYFETGTLGAMAAFMDARPDVAILEVGLGGRLDAVNVFDADAALVTSVDLDHQQWLGADREVIGREKAGVFRRGRPAVCADPAAPASVAATAHALGAHLVLAGRDYRWWSRNGGWCWSGAAVTHEDLPAPALPGAHQLRNAAGAIALLQSMAGRLPVSPAAVRGGIAGARLEGRLELRPGSVSWLYDVAHNPEAARALAAFLARMPHRGRVHALFSMLVDKDAVATVDALADRFDQWWIPRLDTARAADPASLASVVAAACPGAGVHWFGSTRDALEALRGALVAGDLVVVFGSFFTVAEAKQLESSPGRPETPRHG